jgi:hypothetical protein
MSGTIRTRSTFGDVVFNARTGKVCKGSYSGIEAIDKLDATATAANLGVTPEQLKEEGCDLVFATFTLKGGRVRKGTRYSLTAKGEQTLKNAIPTGAVCPGRLSGRHFPTLAYTEVLSPKKTYRCMGCGRRIRQQQRPFLAVCSTTTSTLKRDLLWGAAIAVTLALVTVLFYF